MGTILGTIAMLINYNSIRVFSSVGLERYLDRVEVSGSNPLTPTMPPTRLGAFFIPLCELLSEPKDLSTVFSTKYFFTFTLFDVTKTGGGGAIIDTHFPFTKRRKKFWGDFPKYD